MVDIVNMMDMMVFIMVNMINILVNIVNVMVDMMVEMVDARHHYRQDRHHVKTQRLTIEISFHCNDQPTLWVNLLGWSIHQITNRKVFTSLIV